MDSVALGTLELSVDVPGGELTRRVRGYDVMGRTAQCKLQVQLSAVLAQRLRHLSD